MSGLTWFELDVDMPDDPKCSGLAARLGNPLAFGYAVRLYAYCYRHATDRFSGPGAVAIIEETACRWKGKTGALFAALDAEGFIDRDGETLVIHGVFQRLGPHAKKLERDRERAKARRESVTKSIGRRADVRATSPGRRSDVAGDIDRDKDRDSTEITIGTVPPPSLAPPRAARMGVGHPAFEAVKHWTDVAWPRRSSSPHGDITTPQAQRLAGLCSLHGVREVTARMDRAVADKFWGDKLDLDLFIAKFDRFAPTGGPPKPTKRLIAGDFENPPEFAEAK